MNVIPVGFEQWLPAKHWVPTPPQPAGRWVWIPDTPPVEPWYRCPGFDDAPPPSVTCTVTSTATIKIN